MTFIDSLKENKTPFNKESVKGIIEAIINSNELNNSTLKQVISSKRTNYEPSKEETKDARDRIKDLLGRAVVENDGLYACELSGVDNEEALPTLLNEGRDDDSTDSIRFKILKERLYKKVQNYSATRKNLLFDSSKLFPYNEEFKDDDVIKHELVINAVPDKYLIIFEEIFNELVNNKIPFVIYVRSLPEMKYGFADPIQICTSTSNLNDVAVIVNRVLQKYRKDVIVPNKKLYLSCNELFGYTSVAEEKGMFTNKSITPMDVVLGRIENFINEKIQGVDVSDWTERARKLKEYYLNRSASGRFDRFVTDLDSILMYSSGPDDTIGNLDFDNIFVFFDTFPREVKEEQEIPELTSDDEEQLNGYAPLTSSPVINNSPTNEQEKEEIKEIFPHEEQKEEHEIKDIFGDRETRNEDKKEPNKIVKLFNDEEIDTSKLSNPGIYDSPNIEIEELTKEEGSSLTENTFNNTVIAEEYSVYDPIDERNNPNDPYLVLFPRTSSGVDAFDSICSVVVDEQGRTTELIRYLRAQDVEKLFDKNILLKDDQGIISGISFIKTKVMPLFKENTPDNIYTLDRIMDMYVEEVLEKDKPKSKNLLNKIFKIK